MDACYKATVLAPVFLFAGWTAGSATPAPQVVDARVDSARVRVDTFMARHVGENGPGAVVGVVEDGEIVFAGAWGLANLVHGVPITTETRFNIGSVSKQFTAFALALLASRGELSLDDPVRKHLPEIPEFEHEVTLRHLLTHTSGYRETYGMAILAGRSPRDAHRFSREEALEVVQRQPELEFEPGTVHRYNSSAYVLLAEVLQRVTGEPFPQWMERNVFEPLGMDRTVIQRDVEQVIRGAADSYADARGGGYRTAFSNRVYWGAGDIYTTVGDLAEWLRNLGSWELGGAEIRDQMLKRFVLASGDTIDYALGVTVTEERGVRRIRHGGNDAGFSAWLAYYPELDAGIVAMSNDAGLGAGEIVSGIEEIVLGDRLKPRPRVAPSPGGEETTEHVEVPDSLLERYVGEYRNPRGSRVFFRLEDGGFLAQMEGQSAFPMRALDDTAFVLAPPDLDAQVAFHVSEDGSVPRVTLEQGGRRMPAERVTWRPSARELSAYVGRYASPELETYYTLRLDGEGGLVAEHRWNETMELRPVREDFFRAEAALPIELRFRRDEEGNVMGYSATLGRTADVWFEKRE